MFVREGDYNKDKEVPKPLLEKPEIVQRTDDVREKPKTVKKRTASKKTNTKGKKKGKYKQKKASKKSQL